MNGILIQFAAATAAKGTYLPMIGGSLWNEWVFEPFNENQLLYFFFKNDNLKSRYFIMKLNILILDVSGINVIS